MKIVIKIGSNILADATRGLNSRRIASLSRRIMEIIAMGHEVIVVSSGAIAAGAKKMKLTKRPTEIRLKQATAAVGQTALVWEYEKNFKKHGRLVAQILLTRDGLANRHMYLNAKNTLLTLLENNVIPIINENDTVATDELKFGDNDQLAALVAALVEADRLIILSDVDGLYDANPATTKSARLIETVTDITDDILRLADAGTNATGTGGMYSKVMAARKAIRSGIMVSIINGRKPARLVSLMSGKPQGTLFLPDSTKLNARRGWIAYGVKAKGSLVLDEGAVRAVEAGHKSLLPSGIREVQGVFQIGDAVACVTSEGRRIAKGITNYSSAEIEKIKGRKTAEIDSILGYRYSDEVIHCDNIVLS